MWAHLRSAVLVGRLGDPSECSRRLDAARRRWPDEVGPLVCLAQRATELGDGDRAALHWTAILQLDPTNLWAALHLAEIASKRGDRGACDSHLDRARTHHPDRPEVWGTIARIAAADHRWSEAERAWRTVIDLVPDDGVACHGLALSAEHRDRPAEAIEHYRRLADDHELTHSQTIALARCHARRGEDERVAALLTGLIDGALVSGETRRESQRQITWGLIASGRADLAREAFFEFPAVVASANVTTAILAPMLSALDGHHLALTRFWCDWLGEHGLGPVEILTHRRFDRSRLAEDLDSTPHFSLEPTVPVEWATTDRSVRRFNDAYAQELVARHSLADRRLVVDHSCRLSTIGGLISWLHATDGPHERVAVAGLVDTDYLSPRHPHHDIALTLWDDIAEQAAELRGTRLLVTAETDAGTAFLRRRLPPSVAVLLTPYLPATRLALGTRTGREAITIGHLGGTRLERGPELLAPVVEALLSSQKSRIRVVLQVDVDRVRRLFGRAVAARLADVLDHDAVEHVPVGVTEHEYRRLVETIDVMVLPYTDRYQVAASGIFLEGMATGKVQVVPAASSMADIARRYDSGTAWFDRSSPGAVVDAVGRALAELDDRRTLARRAALRWRADQSTIRSSVIAAIT